MVKYNREVKENRVFDFLVGLNSKYDIIHIQILGKEPLHHSVKFTLMFKKRRIVVTPCAVLHHLILQKKQHLSLPLSVVVKEVSVVVGVVVGVVFQGMTKISLNVITVAVFDIRMTLVVIYMVVPRNFRVVLLNEVLILGAWRFSIH